MKELKEGIVSWIWGISILTGFFSTVYCLGNLLKTHFENNLSYEISFVICCTLSIIIYKYLHSKEQEAEDIEKRVINFLYNIKHIDSEKFLECNIIKNITLPESSYEKKVYIILKNENILSTSLEQFVFVFEYGTINMKDLLSFDNQLSENYSKQPEDYCYTIHINNEKSVFLYPIKNN